MKKSLMNLNKKWRKLKVKLKKKQRGSLINRQLIIVFKCSNSCKNIAKRQATNNIKTWILRNQIYSKLMKKWTRKKSEINNSQK